MATTYSQLHEYEKCIAILTEILAVVPEIKLQMAVDSGFNNLRNSAYADTFYALLT